jgi:hypothetical protein
LRITRSCLQCPRPRFDPAVPTGTSASRHLLCPRSPRRQDPRERPPEQVQSALTQHADGKTNARQRHNQWRAFADHQFSDCATGPDGGGGISLAGQADFIAALPQAEPGYGCSSWRSARPIASLVSPAGSQWPLIFISTVGNDLESSGHAALYWYPSNSQVISIQISKESELGLGRRLTSPMLCGGYGSIPTLSNHCPTFSLQSDRHCSSRSAILRARPVTLINGSSGSCASLACCSACSCRAIFRASSEKPILES